jgi:hypothetical protein
VENLLAYIDPGSGSLIIQAVIATIVAVPILLRSQIARGIGAVRRMTGREEAATAVVDEAGHRG